MINLKQTAIWGIFIGFSEKLIAQSLLFFSHIVMMRILSTKAYGQIGILLIFISVSMILIDLGLRNALIQKKNASIEDFSTAFWLSSIICLFCYSALFLGASTIANFFNEPELRGIVKILGLNLFFCSIGLVPQTILIKKMKYGSLARISIISSLFSGIIGVILAYHGFGVWAIVGQLAAMYLCHSLLSVWEANWLPLIVLDRDSIVSLTGFGNKMLLSNMIDQFFINFHVSIIGKYFNNQVGYLSQANKFQSVINGLFSIPIHTVSFSTMSASNDDSISIQIVFKKFIQMSSFFTFPVILFLIAIAEPSFKILFGEKWAPAAPMFMWLGASNLFSSINAINHNVLKSRNKVGELLVSNAIRKFLLFASIVIGLNWGVIGVLIALFFSSITEFFVNAYFTWRIINVSIMKQCSYIWRIAVNSALMFSTIMLIDKIQISNCISIILLKFTVALIVYSSGAHLICKTNVKEALSYSLGLYSKFKPSLKIWAN
jgi:O-antigen/teichoic acid export membrane protein